MPEKPSRSSQKDPNDTLETVSEEGDASEKGTELSLTKGLQRLFEQA